MGSEHTERLSAGLRKALDPVREFFAADDVEEIFINRPGEVFVKTNIATNRFPCPALTYDECLGLCILVANARDQRIGEDAPLLTTALPADPSFCDAQLRFTAVIPPCVEPGLVSIAIRKQSIRNFTLEDLGGGGLFRTTQVTQRDAGEFAGSNSGHEMAMVAGSFQRRVRRRALPSIAGADEAATAGDIVTLLRLLVRHHRNIMVSGPTGSGKTTVLNALAKEIPAHERIVSIEDARELRCDHPNRVHLLCPSNDGGIAKTSARELLRHMLRMSPTRALLSEIRGPEAYTYLEALNTGHPGSLSTIHADSAEDAKTRLAMAAARAFDGLRDADMRDLVEEYVDVFLHVKPLPDGRLVSEIQWL